MIRFKGCLDHILYNENAMTLLELLEVPSEADLSEGGAIPNLLFPSDHVRIEAKFLLNE